MVTRLEDFMRRRSKIALVVRREDLREAPGLREACDILFGPLAEVRLREYLDGLEQADAARPDAARPDAA